MEDELYPFLAYVYADPARSTYNNGMVRGEVDAASDAVGYGINAAAVLVER